MTDILVNAVGLILMAAIVGWFWLSDSTGDRGSDRNTSSSHNH